jgi:hypothetical protein
MDFMLYYIYHGRIREQLEGWLWTCLNDRDSPCFGGPTNDMMSPCWNSTYAPFFWSLCSLTNVPFELQKKVYYCQLLYSHPLNIRQFSRGFYEFSLKTWNPNITNIYIQFLSSSVNKNEHLKGYKTLKIIFWISNVDGDAILGTEFVIRSLKFHIYITKFSRYFVIHRTNVQQIKSTHLFHQSTQNMFCPK